MAGKNIVIFTNHFYPEDFKVNDVAFELAKNGHSVTVLTGIPNYPKGVFFEGYGIFKKNKEIINGIKIIRIPLIPRGNGTSIRLILNYISYAFFLCVCSFFISLFNKYDIILVHHTSPIFLGFPAVQLKKKQGAKLIFWNLDLWPESITAAGNINNRFILTNLNKLVKYIYSNSDKILISSKGFESSIFNKGIPHEKIIYFPNWAEDIFTAKVQIENVEKGNELRIMFAGNIGEAQDMENIVEAISIIKQKNISVKFLFVGSGRKLEWLKEKILSERLNNVVELLGRYPLNDMPKILAQADVLLVSLKNEPIFSLTVPAKVQTYMASGKTILTMLDGEGSKIVAAANCGLTAPAGDYQKLVDNIIKIFNLSPEQRNKLGENGCEYYKNNFSKNLIMKKLLNLI